MYGIERLVSCARCCMEDCPHIESARMQAVCYMGSPEVEGRSGSQGASIMSNYREAESLCRDCPYYLPKDAG